MSKHPQTLLFCDLEFSGLDPLQHEILEIAIIKEVDGKYAGSFHSLVKPVHIENADPVGLRMNGYEALPSKWYNAPLFEQIADPLDVFCRQGTFVGQNISADILFLQEAYKQIGKPGRLDYRPGDCRKLDVSVLTHEHLVPCGLQSTGMDSVRKFLGWSMVGAHTAMKDAEDARRLYHLLLRATVFHRLWWRFKVLCGVQG